MQKRVNKFNPANKVVTVRLTEAEYEAYEKLCYKRGDYKGPLLRTMMLNSLKQHGIKVAE